MSDFIKDGLSWLAGVQREQVSQTATIRRGTKSTAGVPVTLGRADTELDAVGNVTLKTAEKVFWIRPADYAFAGAEEKPVAGDLIDLTENGATTRFRVPETAKNEPAYAWDEYRLMFKLTAKFQKVL